MNAIEKSYLAFRRAADAFQNKFLAGQKRLEDDVSPMFTLCDDGGSTGALGLSESARSVVANLELEMAVVKVRPHMCSNKADKKCD